MTGSVKKKSMSKKTLNCGLGNWMVVDGVPEEEAVEDHFGIGQSVGSL